jgi:dihydrofolate reductase
MRKIVASLFMSLDGVVESPEKWTGPYFSSEVSKHVGARFAEGDLLLLGRVTYQTFAASFADQAGGMADQMNGFPKAVVSHTLDEAGWQNSTLISGDAAAGVKELKQRPGADINVSGSAMLVRWLLREGLLDELDLLVYPVVVSAGKRLFDDRGEGFTMALKRCTTFGNGVVNLGYSSR